MALFTQEIILGIKNKKNILEKEEFVVEKKNINIRVKDGTVAYINGIKYNAGDNFVNIKDSFDTKKKEKAVAYLYPAGGIREITIHFFAGQHQLSLDINSKAKGTFSVVGDAKVIVDDYTALAKNYERAMTEEELIEDINNTYRDSLKNEMTGIIDRKISIETTEQELKGMFNDIIDEMVSKNGGANSTFARLGLVLRKSGISLKLNRMEDADELNKQFISKINDKALGSFDKEDADEEYQRGQTELEKSRQFDIDMERAKNTSISESKTEVINSGNGNVTINQKSNDKYCIKCGAKIPANALYCPNCGEKQ